MVIEAINAGLAQISIHALRVEGDMVIEAINAGLAQISIHALRVEGDLDYYTILLYNYHFYPRPPGGGRRRTPQPLCQS